MQLEQPILWRHYNHGMAQPLIAITVDNRRDQPAWYESPAAYSRAIEQAGGVPVMMAQRPELARAYATRCDGFLLTGGDDPCMELLGRSTHPRALVMARSRQMFEWALLEALESRPDRPVLGVCLGMQMMALFHGGDLHQHLPDLLSQPLARSHRHKNRHPVRLIPLRPDVAQSLSPAHRALLTSWGQGDMQVVSSHHQAVSRPGAMTVVGRAEDDIVEMIVLSSRRFYVGVQWHPELGGDVPCNQGLFRALIQAV